MLIDGGNAADSSLVVSYLANQGVEYVDYVVCTHAHEDHVGGLSGPLSQYTVGAVFSPVEEYDTKAFSNFAKYTMEQELELTIPEPGDTWTLGDAQIEVLGPVQDYSNTNNTSIVLRVDYGVVSFLFTGDAERLSEEDILESGANMDTTVLKVGHHGSSTSTSYHFLREVNPQYAVISVGEDNEYGHPHDEVMSRLKDAQVTVYRTDLQGHIIAVTDGETVTFTTQKNQEANTNPSDSSEESALTHYIGNRNSQIYHRPTCGSLPAEQNQVLFDSRPDAENAGYTPCSNCKP